MRLFVAIELSEPVRRHLLEMQETLRDLAPGVSWTRGENLHVTLKFLGAVEEGQAPGICEALRGVKRVGELELRAGGVICLPERGPVRIIAAGMQAPPGLLALHQELEAAGAALGFEREDRPFRAHVTLARARSPLKGNARARLMQMAEEASGPAMAVREFVLMQSHLTNAGATYQPLERFDITLPSGRTIP